MSEVQQNTVREPAPLPSGDIVFVPAADRFGRIRTSFENTQHGLIYLVRLYEPGPGERSIQCLPRAVWHLPELTRRPLCQLTPHGSRA